MDTASAIEESVPEAHSIPRLKHLILEKIIGQELKRLRATKTASNKDETARKQRLEEVMRFICEARRQEFPIFHYQYAKEDDKLVNFRKLALEEFVKPITDEKLREYEDDNDEIETLEVSWNQQNGIEVRNCITTHVPEKPEIPAVRDSQHRSIEEFNAQLLLEIIHHLIPLDSHTRSINLLQVSLPLPLPPLADRNDICDHQLHILGSWKTYWNKHRSSLEQRIGKLHVKRLKMILEYSLSTDFRDSPEPYFNQASVKKWIEEHVVDEIGALTVVPYWLERRHTNPWKYGYGEQHIRDKEIELTGEGVGLATVPQPQEKELDFATTLCPDIHAVELQGKNHRWIDHCTIATRIDRVRKYWQEKKQELKLHSLIMVVKYCTGFREDIMRAINNAVSEGIIVVCPAGLQPNISFPASMGNVICVGTADEHGHPAPDSPSGREIDWITKHIRENDISSKGSHGDAVTVAAANIALLCSRINKLKHVDHNTEHLTHTAVIKEVLKETTQFRTHEARRGYGLLTQNILSFPDSKLRKIFDSITSRTCRKLPGVTVTTEYLKQQCTHNTEALANEQLNSEMQLGVILEGKEVKVAVIDDDFPESLIGEYKQADSLQKEIVEFDKNATVLMRQRERLDSWRSSVEDTMSILEKDGSQWSQEAVASLKKTADSLKSAEESLDSVECDHKLTTIDDSHGLKCTLVLTNMLPKAKLLLMNSSGEEDDSTNLAETIDKVVNENCPDILVCSMAFDNFNPKLAKAINDAINKGVIPVVTAGNIGQISRNTISYPAKFGNAICIGAHSPYGAIQDFSSVGREVDFLAPGEFMILDKFPVSGTSFAAPAAAAMIALVLEYAASKVVTDEENGKYAHVRTWSEYPPDSGNWQWEMRPTHQACHNVYVMRQLLRQISVLQQNSLDATVHQPGLGHGLIDITRLAIDLNPTDLHRIVEEFNDDRCRTCLAGISHPLYS